MIIEENRRERVKEWEQGSVMARETNWSRCCGGMQRWRRAGEDGLRETKNGSKERKGFRRKLGKKYARPELKRKGGKGEAVEEQENGRGE